MKTIHSFEDLISELRSKDGARRMQAREALVTIGKPAVPFLVELLTDKSEIVRWEACKALRRIKDVSTAEALANALNDESMAVQWLAAEALIMLKTAAVLPLLELLEKKFESPFVRQGAHHVLHAFEREGLLNDETIAVVDSLRSLGPNVMAALAAQKALAAMGTLLKNH
jgi:HEAT repeat protein